MMRWSHWLLLGCLMLGLPSFALLAMAGRHHVWIANGACVAGAVALLFAYRVSFRSGEVAPRPLTRRGQVVVAVGAVVMAAFLASLPWWHRSEPPPQFWGSHVIWAVMMSAPTVYLVKDLASRPQRAALALLCGTMLLALGSVVILGKEPRLLATGAIPCLVAACLLLVAAGRQA